eukprot:jgi/Astpho2/5995/Aster-03952
MVEVWTEQQDPYAMLGLEEGSKSTDADIKKAFRMLALKKHPDKQRDNPNAAAEFNLIQRAYELLSDAQARAALDDLHRHAFPCFCQAQAARQARQAGQSDKRRKMQQDLAKREEAWQTERSAEQQASSRLKSELERLRKQAAERQAQQSAQMARHRAVSWDKGSAQHDAASLRCIFERHGRVEDVVLKAGKKRSSSALVVMSTLDAAIAAAEAVNGDLQEPLQTVPLSKVAPAAPDAAAAVTGQPGSSSSGLDALPEGGQEQAGSVRPSAVRMPAVTPPSSPVKDPDREDVRAGPAGLTRFGLRPPPRNPFGSPATSSVFGARPSSFPGASVFGARPSSFPGMPQQQPAASQSSVLPGKGFGFGNKDFEDVTLMKLRQAAERAEVIRQMQADEDHAV